MSIRRPEQVPKGFVICLSTGRQLAFKAKPKDAQLIAQEIQMAKLTWDELRRDRTAPKQPLSKF